MPDLKLNDLTNLEFKGSKNSAEEQTLGSWTSVSQMQAAKIAVSTGQWTFTLTAKAGGENGTILSGCCQKEIELGDNALNFVLSISDDGAGEENRVGSFEITLDYSGAENADKISYVTGSLENMAGTPVTGFTQAVQLTPASNSVIFAANDIPAGTYRAKVKFYANSNQTGVDNFEIATYRELIQISSGLTSSATRQIESFDNLYSITYSIDGGTLPEGTTLQETYTRKTPTIILPTISKDYYTFDGWYTNEYFTDESKVTQIKEQLSDISVYAKFTPIEYTITYMFNDGVTPNETQKYTYFERVNLKTPYYEGKRFYGWFEKEDFSCDETESWDSATYHKDMMLYANWIGLVVSAENIASKIQSLTEDGTFVVTGELNAQKIANINAALKKCSESVYVSLDLSRVSGLDALGYRAFYGCIHLKEIVLPETIETIGDFAFSDCTGLSCITLPDQLTDISIYAFSNCTSLTSVTIPNSVTSIKDGAFNDCSGLTSLIIPGSLNSIGNFAFGNCTGLEHVVISEGVTTIGFSSFNNCTGLKTIEIPQSLITIKSNAFYCSSIRESTVYFKGTLEQWCAINLYSYDSNPCWCGAHLFIGDDELPEDFEFPNTVKRIGFYSFSGCRIKKVTIPNTVEFIGAGAFSGCVYLTDVILASNVTFGFDIFPDYLTVARAESPFGSYDYQPDCKTRIKNVTICEGVTTIAYSLFSNCTELESIVIPNSVTKIGNNAFSRCEALVNVSIPSSVISIGEEAFSQCNSLTSLIIPASITSIGYYAFSFCENLQSLEISTPTISDGAFSFCINLSNLIINNSVKKIEDNAFECCSGLTNLYIPASVTNVGLYAFANCGNLTELKLGNENDVVSDSVMIIDTYAFYECNLKNVDIYCNCAGTQADDYVSLFYLYNSENEINISIHDGVKIIGDYLFSSCTKFQSVTIPDSVISIGKYAFYNCTGLTSIDIPDSVKNIGEYAFNGCIGLTDATFETTSGWKAGNIDIDPTILSDPATATTYLKDIYCDYTWTRTE